MGPTAALCSKSGTPPPAPLFSLYMAYRILVHCPQIKPVPPAVEAQSLNHWTIREILTPTFKTGNFSGSQSILIAICHYADLRKGRFHNLGSGKHEIDGECHRLPLNCLIYLRFLLAHLQTFDCQALSCSLRSPLLDRIGMGQMGR